MNEQINKGALWEKDSEWLRSSRLDMWNPDYFSFLVRQVWKIDRPVKIIDFGCGIGYLASVLLPLLPKGSSYTGLDVNNILLEDARAAFADTEWPVEFIQQDLTKYIPEEKYDIAICQTLLIHIPSPFPVLKKMVDSVAPGGRVICIEPSWAFTSIGTYRHGMETYSYEDFGTYQKLHDNALKIGVRDPYIGIKLPALMHDLGLKNIDIRINDKANFTFKEPDRAKASEDRDERRKKHALKEYFISLGLEPDETERHLENILKTEDFENDREEPLPIVSVSAWLISFGEK